ncbi:Tat pathway signal sequence protein [Rutstroemia sp. NJR-2017a BVV2]|nr:Tat pathway signal sequence protein [Rutstroemia sp. NJR-2017a BVV2]
MQIDWKFNPGEENSSQEELLEAISLDDGAIAVSKDWAIEKGLGETSPFPWDESKLVYFIHAYHGLHCVKLIYRFVKEVRDTDTQTVPLEHVIHCLDAMRKDIMCYADDTPRPRRYEANSTVAIKAEGELRQCRDWSVLESWAKERPACFQAGNADPGDMLHSQLRFCPEDSPYLPAVRQYFGKDDE